MAISEQVDGRKLDDSEPLRLAVTIDTEEEGLWSGQYRSEATVENIRGVPRFQEVCDANGVRPTYLVTTPVARSDMAVEILRSIQDSGRCEIGTHVHPWNSPPLLEEASSGRNSFLCNLPPEIQRAKIEGLTKLIEQQFCQRPISFRAGRYGMGIEGIKILRDLGYRVDSSVIPYTSYASQGGPDFSSATCESYYPGEVAIIERTTNQSLLEVPVTVGFTHSHFRLAHGLRSFAMRSPFRQLKSVGILDRSGIACKVKLSPEQASLEQMQRLARSLVRRGTRTLILMFHSSSLMPGCSPYVVNDDELDGFLQRLDHFFRFCIGELRCDPIPLGEFYEHRSSLASV
ncbi:MAG: polysaccharide deacetylase family protein [Planctomycetota bacterium]|nr:polysaccharide deacetylase family protein [Planctomycetota bacterium]